MSELIALVREPAPSFARALSTHPARNDIDVHRALRQHRAYVRALRQAGARVVYLQPDESLADAPFVEDTAIILDDRALICSPKAPSRRGEAQSVIPEIRKHRSLEILEPPVFIDGGDVLNVGGTLYVGLSQRTNQQAVEYLRKQTPNPVVAVPVLRGLHLKSAVSRLNDETLIIDPSRVEASALQTFRRIEVTAGETYAANCLAIGNHAILPEGYPRVAQQIEALGLTVLPVPMSEFEKADGGVTCLSLIVRSA
ncbi:MAG: dimethylarginine dimethylaminohydrolase family protein [Nitrospinales bacterium]